MKPYAINYLLKGFVKHDHNPARAFRPLDLLSVGAFAEDGFAFLVSGNSDRLQEATRTVILKEQRSRA